MNKHYTPKWLETVTILCKPNKCIGDCACVCVCAGFVFFFVSFAGGLKRRTLVVQLPCDKMPETLWLVEDKWGLNAPIGL